MPEITHLDIQNTRNPEIVKICYSLLLGSRATPIFYLTSKPSFQELQFNTELIF